MAVTYLVQLSDLHVCEPGRLANGRIDTSDYVRPAVRGVMQLRQAPDAQQHDALLRLGHLLCRM